MSAPRFTYVLALLAIVLALRAWATLGDVSWLWGLDALRDLPLWARVAGLLLFGAALLPGVGTQIMRGIDRLSERRRTGAGIALGAFGLLLILLPTTHALHGDAQVYLSSLEKGMHAAGAAHREPLPQFLITMVHRVIGAAGGSSALTFRICGWIAGLAFLGVTIALAARLSDTIRGRTLLVAVAASGAWPLFAGHAELYAFSLVAVAAFVFAGLRWIDGRGRFVWVGITYAACGLCHALLALALPGFLLLAWEQWRRGDRRTALLATAAVPLVVAAALLLLRYPFGDLARELQRADAFLPPLGETRGRTAYGMFSWIHGVELVNVCLLVTPLLIPLLPLAIFPRRSSRTKTLELRFLAASAIGPILFVCAANPALGMVRDWDLYAPALLLAAFWVGAAAIPSLELSIRPIARSRSREATLHEHQSASTRLDRPSRALAGLLFLTATLHGTAWLAANHQQRYAESRLRRIAGNPALFAPVSRGEVWRYLAAADARDGDGRGAASAYLAAIRADPRETIPYRHLATLSLQGALARGRPAAEGIAAYHEALALGPFGKVEAHFGAVSAAVQAAQESLAVAEGQRMLAAAPNSPEYQAVWGDLARRAGEVAEADGWYDRALAAEPRLVRALIGKACLAGMRGESETMRQLTQRALEAYPFSTQAQQFEALLERGGGVSPQQCQAIFFSR
jgi:tetratricopeptide (TPR) repeat protein